MNNGISVNLEYEQLQTELDKAWDIRRQIMRDGESRWKAIWHPIWKKQFGKGKKRNAEPNGKDFTPLEFEAMQLPLKHEIMPAFDAINARMKEIRERLDFLAPHLDFVQQPFYTLIRTTSSSSYHTQGFGAMMYARAELQVFEVKLKELGFNVVVRSVNERYVPGVGCGVNHGDFELWADCTEAMGDAALKLVTIGDAIKLANATGVNVQVLLAG